jgi:hypothetical protein
MPPATSGFSIVEAKRAVADGKVETGALVLSGPNTFFFAEWTLALGTKAAGAAGLKCKHKVSKAAIFLMVFQGGVGVDHVRLQPS